MSRRTGTCISRASPPSIETVTSNSRRRPSARVSVATATTSGPIGPFRIQAGRSFTTCSSSAWHDSPAWTISACPSVPSVPSWRAVPRHARRERERADVALLAVLDAAPPDSRSADELAARRALASVGVLTAGRARDRRPRCLAAPGPLTVRSALRSPDESTSLRCAW